MTVLVYKRDGSVKVLEDYRDISVKDYEVEFTNWLVGGDDGYVSESIPRSDVVKVEVLL